MTSVYLASPVGAMFDASKGCISNRKDCAKEHFKNNLGFAVSTGIVSGGALAVAYNPTAASVFAKVANKLGTGIGKILPKVGLKELAQKVMKNPTKAGKIGLVLAAGILLYDQFCHTIFKSGQIDQKYTDRANEIEILKRKREMFYVK